MKIFLAVLGVMSSLLGGLDLRAQDANQLKADASSPAAVINVSPEASSSNGEAVEQHFQAARRLYLAGDRDAALGELNQALRLDPYHSGSTSLYRTIHEEELSLRQVRLPSQELAPVAAPQAAASPAPVAAAATQASRNFWHSVLNFQDHTVRRLDGLEKDSSKFDGELGVIKSEVDGQKELLGVVNQDLKRVSVRQDNLMLGLLALLVALIVLLIMTLRMLMGMRGELSTVESRLHEHPGAKRR
jgi:hypothetical protein